MPKTFTSSKIKKSLILLLSVFQIYNTNCDTQTFTNPSPIAIPVGATATPYPSIINVSGFNPDEKICKITATIKDLTYNQNTCIKILLVGPQNQVVELIACQDFNIAEPNAVTYTFDDSATNFLTCGVLDPSGTYKPTACYGEENDPLTPPAPQTAPYSLLLSDFSGTNPNGTWQLFVDNTDFGFNTGNIAGGWSITITTTEAKSTTLTSCNDSSLNIDLSTLVSGTPPFTFTTTNPLNGTLTGTNGNLTYTPNPGFIGNDKFIYFVTDDAGCQNSNTVFINVISCSDIVRAIKAKYC